MILKIILSSILFAPIFVTSRPQYGYCSFTCPGTEPCPVPCGLQPRPCPRPYPEPCPQPYPEPCPRPTPCYQCPPQNQCWDNVYSNPCQPPVVLIKCGESPNPPLQPSPPPQCTTQPTNTRLPDDNKKNNNNVNDHKNNNDNNINDINTHKKNNDNKEVQEEDSGEENQNPNSRWGRRSANRMGSEHSGQRRPKFFSTLFSIPGAVADSMMCGEITLK